MRVRRAHTLLAVSVAVVLVARTIEVRRRNSRSLYEVLPLERVATPAPQPPTTVPSAAETPAPAESMGAAPIAAVTEDPASDSSAADGPASDVPTTTSLALVPVETPPERPRRLRHAVMTVAAVIAVICAVLAATIVSASAGVRPASSASHLTRP